MFEACIAGLKTLNRLGYGMDGSGLFFLIYVLLTALSLPGAALMTLVGSALFGLLGSTLLVSFASPWGPPWPC
ncbi:hypothetical protein ACFSHR_03360 [Azotobacter chroococcum]